LNSAIEIYWTRGLSTPRLARQPVGANFGGRNLALRTSMGRLDTASDCLVLVSLFAAPYN
jgi:hypothetical protein